MADNPALRHLLAADAGQFFAVAVEQLYPTIRRAVPPTRSAGHSCLYLTSGTATMRIGSETHTIGAGEVLLVRAGQLFSFAPGDVNTGYLCFFQDDFLREGAGSTPGPAVQELLRVWGPPFLPLDAPTTGFVRQLLHRLLVEYGQHQLRYPEVLRAYLLALLSELGRACRAAATPVGRPATRLANRFKQLVATTIHKTHLVSEFAAALHVTPNHLTKAVTTATGKSPGKWIEETIVLEAKVMLYQSDWPVGEIARAVGLADASYFSRLFKKHEGVTPLGFRKMIEKS